MNTYICPKCYEDFYKENTKTATKIGLIENDKLLEEKEKQLPHTAKEDYEIYIEPRTKHFFVYYTCHCSVCNFHFEYKADVPINIDAKWYTAIFEKYIIKEN